MQRYIVYIHINRLNAKPYIGWAVVEEGQSPHDAMMRRWKVRCCNTRNDLFPRAIRKHGEAAFDHEVIEVMSTREGVKHTEKLWIAQRKTCAFEQDGRGYNMTRGGDGGGLLGHVFSKEHRARISAALKGRPRSQETREHLSRVKKGKPSTFKGKRHSTDALALQSKNARHARLTDAQRHDIVARWANRVQVPVTQHQLGIDNGVTQSTVCRLLAGQTWDRSS